MITIEELHSSKVNPTIASWIFLSSLRTASAIDRRQFLPLIQQLSSRKRSKMDEGKAMAARQHQQQLLLQQHKQQQQQQQQQQTQQHQHFLILQQLQKQQQAQQQAAAISRFPSNIDAHLRPPGLHLRPGSINLHQNPNPNPTASGPNLQSNPSPSQPPSQQLQQQQQQQQQQNHQLQQRAMRPGNHPELQMAYQDAWRVCHPDIKRPFGSLEDACERFVFYFVVNAYINCLFFGAVFCVWFLNLEWLCIVVAYCLRGFYFYLK